MTVSLSGDGATVLSIQSEEARDRGVLEGDVITHANGRPIHSAADIDAAISSVRGSRAPILLRIRHSDGSAAFIAVSHNN